MYAHMCIYIYMYNYIYIYILESACALRAHLILLFAGTGPSNISLIAISAEAFPSSACVCDFKMRSASFGAK